MAGYRQKNLVSYFVYIIECHNGTLYTGYTTDIHRRYQEHCAGTAACKYTRSFPPKKLAAYWEFDVDLSTILKIEACIKKLSKHQKLSLIQAPQTLETLSPELTPGLPGVIHESK